METVLHEVNSSEAIQRLWLDQFSQLHQQSYGYELINIGNIGDYLRLRKALGITAGYTRNVNPLSSTLAPQYSDNARHIAHELYFKGYHVISTNIFSLLNSFELEEIRNFLSRSSEYSKRSTQSNLQFAGLLKAAFRLGVLDAVSLYLNTLRPYYYCPHVLHATAAKTLGSDEKYLSDHAFSYHRDIDNIKWIKIFVVLSSCTGGEHEFIQTSHRSTCRSLGSAFHERSQEKRFESPFFAQTHYESHLHTGRQCEVSLMDLYGENSIIKFQTTEGFCWIEDTYGLHRGNPPSTGKRYVASFEIGQFPVRLSV